MSTVKLDKETKMIKNIQSLLRLKGIIITPAVISVITKMYDLLKEKDINDIAIKEVYTAIDSSLKKYPENQNKTSK